MLLLVSFELCSFLRRQFFYFLFYGFSRPISDVGGRKKNKNKIQDLNFFYASSITKKNLISQGEEGIKKSVNKRSIHFPNPKSR